MSNIIKKKSSKKNTVTIINDKYGEFIKDFNTFIKKFDINSEINVYLYNGIIYIDIYILFQILDIPNDYISNLTEVKHYIKFGDILLVNKYGAIKITSHSDKPSAQILQDYLLESLFYKSDINNIQLLSIVENLKSELKTNKVNQSELIQAEIEIQNLTEKVENLENSNYSLTEKYNHIESEYNELNESFEILKETVITLQTECNNYKDLVKKMHKFNKLKNPNFNMDIEEIEEDSDENQESLKQNITDIKKVIKRHKQNTNKKQQVDKIEEYYLFKTQYPTETLGNIHEYKYDWMISKEMITSMEFRKKIKIYSYQISFIEKYLSLSSYDEITINEILSYLLC